MQLKRKGLASSATSLFGLLLFLAAGGYNYASIQEGQTTTRSPVLSRPDIFRAEATKELEKELGEVKDAGQVGGPETLFQSGNRSVPGPGGTAGARSYPAVDEEGNIQLTHWSRTKGLKKLDPSHHGEGLRGADPDNWKLMQKLSIIT